MYQTILDIMRPKISFVVLTNNEKKTTALTLTPGLSLVCFGQRKLTKISL
jgi:hypothetical protein